MRLTIWPNFCPLPCLLIPIMTTKQKHTGKVSTHFPCNLETLKWYGSFPTRKLWSLILFARKFLFLFLLLKYIFKGKVIASNHIQQVVVESLSCGTWEVVGQIWAWFLLSEGSQARSRQSVSDRSSSSPPAGTWTNPRVPTTETPDSKPFLPTCWELDQPRASNYRNSRFLVLIPAPNPEQITLLP